MADFFIINEAETVTFFETATQGAPGSASANADDITSGTLALARGGTGASLTDPNADRLFFWDDSAGATAFLSLGTNLSITGTTINAAGGGGAWDDITDKPAAITTIAGLTPTNDDVLQYKAGAWANRTIAQLKTDLGYATVASTGAYSDLSGIPSTFTPAAHNQAWSTITSTPTTRAGYGITDAVSTALSNLASVSINASLIPQTTLDLGAAATAWRDLYLYGSGTFGSHSIRLTGTPTGNRTLTLPDATDTVAVLGTAQAFSAAQSFSSTIALTSTIAANNKITQGAAINIGTTSTDGIVLQNTTAAAAGAQQFSPRIRLTGQGWKTNATAGSQTVDWGIENVPVQGAANPTANLTFSAQVNGGGYSAVMSLTNGGVLQFGGTTSSFTALRNSNTSLEARLADNSDYAKFRSGAFESYDGGGNAKVCRSGTSILGLAQDVSINWANNSSYFAGTADLFMRRAAAATFAFGTTDAAAPVAQNFTVQNVVAGTTNTAGATWTFKGSAGTGTGAGGAINFQVAPAGTTGTAQNSFSTVLSLATSSTSRAVGFFGATPVVQQSIGAAATDAATTQTLANNLRTALINLGLCTT